VNKLCDGASDWLTHPNPTLLPTRLSTLAQCARNQGDKNADKNAGESYRYSHDTLVRWAKTKMD